MAYETDEKQKSLHIKNEMFLCICVCLYVQMNLIGPAQNKWMNLIGEFWNYLL